jgi:hypothetical protein
MNSYHGWHKTGHTGRDRGLSTAIPANGTELTSRQVAERLFWRPARPGYVAGSAEMWSRQEWLGW